MNAEWTAFKYQADYVYHVNFYVEIYTFDIY